MKLNALKVVACFSLLLPNPAAAKCPQAKRADFEAVWLQTLSAIYANDANKLISVLSPDGVVIGIDGPVIPISHFKKQFHKESDFYCDWFTCNGKDGFFKSSIRASSEKNELTYSVNLDYAVVRLQDKSDLEFYYSYTKRCRWELSSVQYI